MTVDLELERAFSRVELVTGVGTRDTGRMCVMSMVACLAGEEHTDNPACASPLIRAFAIPLNDNMQHAARQRLKPFAMRIIGTNDDLDMERAMILKQALHEEILPALGAPPSPSIRVNAVTLAFARMFRIKRLEREAQWMMDRAMALSDGRDSARAVAAAGAVGRLLARSAREAEDPKDTEKFWNLAIDILDRLCNVGERPMPSSRTMVERVTEAVERKERRHVGGIMT